MLTLVAKMEQLRGCEVHPEVHEVLERWLESLQGVQARRRDEMLNAHQRHRLLGLAGRTHEDRGRCTLISSSLLFTQLTFIVPAVCLAVRLSWGRLLFDRLQFSALLL